MESETDEESGGGFMTTDSDISSSGNNSILDSDVEETGDGCETFASGSEEASGTEGTTSSASDSSLQSSSSSTSGSDSTSPGTADSGEDHSTSSSDDETYKLRSLYKSLLESKTPLYPGSDVTILDSYILLYEYALRHSLTKEAFKELIQLVTVHMPSDAKSAKSVYLLQKFFEKHFNDTNGKCYYYCVKCHRAVDGEDAQCLSGCAARVNKFLYVPVEPQLKQRLEGEFKPITQV